MTDRMVQPAFYIELHPLDGVRCNVFIHVSLDNLKRPHLTSVFVNIFSFHAYKDVSLDGSYFPCKPRHEKKRSKSEINNIGRFTPGLSSKCRRCFRAPGPVLQDKSKANTAEPQQRSLR